MISIDSLKRFYEYDNDYYRKSYKNLIFDKCKVLVNILDVSFGVLFC